MITGKAKGMRNDEKREEGRKEGRGGEWPGMKDVEVWGAVVT